MSIASIETMLESMRSVVQTAQSGSINGALSNARQSETTPSVSFADVLQRSLAKVSSVQHAAGAQAQRFDLGDPNVSLNDVMIDLQKASLGFQMTVQVRNKIVAAYKEISSMAM